MHFDIRKSILVKCQNTSNQTYHLLVSITQDSIILQNIIVQYIDCGLKAINIILLLFEVFCINL